MTFGKCPQQHRGFFDAMADGSRKVWVADEEPDDRLTFDRGSTAAAIHVLGTQTAQYAEPPNILIG